MMVAASTLIITSTSCEKNTPAGEIPGCKDIICNAGDQPTFSFSAGADWSLSSDQIWCKFITSSGNLQEMAGHAGSHTITLKISNEDIKNQPTFANITIKMGGKEGIIAKVERGADQLYMKLYDVTDTPMSNIQLGYIDWIPFRLEANFRFAAVDFPEWMEIGILAEGSNSQVVSAGSISGFPGEQIEAYARIIPDGDRERFPIKASDGYTITFSDESGKNTFEFPITYNGMGNDELSFTGPTEQYYDWEVSLDGNTFRQVDSVSGTMYTFEESLDFNIVAQENNYKIIRFEKRIDRGISSYDVFMEGDYSGSASWIKIDRNMEDAGLLTISIGSSSSIRHGMVMALPIGTYELKRGDILGNFFEMDTSSGVELPTVKEEYQKYILMEFTQHDFNELGEYDGMYAYHSLTTLEIPCEAYRDNALSEKYADAQIYKCDFVNSVAEKRPGIIIDPRIEGWTTENYETGKASAELWLGDRKLTIKDDEYTMGENKDERMAAHLWGPKDGNWNNENVTILFKVDDIVKKVLVVTPPIK
jgi:hypothetical protein